MKTAISLPDTTFERATGSARALGMSRSEFFARAAERYLADLEAESVTRQIDFVVDSTTHGDDSASVAVDAGHRRLSANSGDW